MKIGHKISVNSGTSGDFPFTVAQICTRCDMKEVRWRILSSVMAYEKFHFKK